MPRIAPPTPRRESPDRLPPRGFWCGQPSPTTEYKNRYANTKGIVPDGLPGFMGPKKSKKRATTPSPSSGRQAWNYDDDASRASSSSQHSIRSTQSFSLHNRPTFSVRAASPTTATRPFSISNHRAPSPSFEEWRNSRARKPPLPPSFSSDETDNFYSRRTGGGGVGIVTAARSPSPMPSTSTPPTRRESSNRRADSPYRFPANSRYLRAPSPTPLNGPARVINKVTAPTRKAPPVPVPLSAPQPPSQSTPATAALITPLPPPFVFHCDKGDQIIRSLRQCVSDGQALAQLPSTELFFPLSDPNSPVILQTREVATLLVAAWNLTLTTKLSELEQADENYQRDLTETRQLRADLLEAEKSILDLDDLQTNLKAYLEKLKRTAALSRAANDKPTDELKEPNKISLALPPAQAKRAHLDELDRFCEVKATLRGVAAVEIQPSPLRELDLYASHTIVSNISYLDDDHKGVGGAEGDFTFQTLFELAGITRQE